MGQVLGLGISHYPPLSGRDEDMANIVKGRMRDPDIPAEARDPARWPAPMREEWGSDEGAAAAGRHRAAMRAGLQRVRAALDDFRPDFVLMWGDDQYENFQDDVIPAFAVLAYGDMDLNPWKHASASAMVSASTKDEWGGGKPNVWNEGADALVRVRGHAQAARHIASELLQADFDIAYAYRPLHHPGLAHAFLNAVLYLDYDRRGFDHPVVPVSINCYGRRIVSHRGFISRWADRHRPFDPPSPSPRRCFEFGAAIGRIVRDSPWRVALMASSSWSHAFLVDKTWRMQPDVDSDRVLYRAMVEADYGRWRERTLDDIEDAGQQEVLNWFALVGAMSELGHRVAWSEFVESRLFNSNKVAAIFEPGA
jgi:hypothetical protein